MRRANKKITANNNYFSRNQLQPIVSPDRLLRGSLFLFLTLSSAHLKFTIAG